jgi:hypothetical protein
MGKNKSDEDLGRALLEVGKAAAKYGPWAVVDGKIILGKKLNVLDGVACLLTLIF